MPAATPLTPKSSGPWSAGLSWLAVKVLKLSYHYSETALLAMYP